MEKSRCNKMSPITFQFIGLVLGCLRSCKKAIEEYLKELWIVALIYWIIGFIQPDATPSTRMMITSIQPLIPDGAYKCYNQVQKLYSNTHYWGAAVIFLTMSLVYAFNLIANPWILWPVQITLATIGIQEIYLIDQHRWL